MDGKIATPAARVAGKPAKRRVRSHFRSEAITGWLFVLPWIIGFTAFTLGPMLFSLYTSFTDYNIIRAPNWVGLENYREIFFRDEYFWISLRNTFWMVLVKTPIVLALALGLAVLLNMDLPGTRIFRTVIYLPTVLSGVAAIFLWEWMLEPNGLLNSGLQLFGIRGPAWLSDATWTKPAFVIMGLWYIGVDVIIYLASLRGIDKSLYEAAEIDGANGWMKNLYITIPLLTPTTFFLVITGIIGTFQIFTTAYIITTDPAVKTLGGTEHSLLFYVLYLYKCSFGQDACSGRLEMGYGSALAWILFVIIMVITVIQLGLAKRWVHYEADR
ncbi:MAG TPA: sugar ABC transporter permease [Trueperaceae bacterium]